MKQILKRLWLRIEARINKYFEQLPLLYAQLELPLETCACKFPVHYIGGKRCLACDKETRTN